VLLKPELAAVILPHMEWIKVSINAGTREGYAKVHRTKPEDFDTVISNLSHAVELKKSKGYSCALGMQMVLIPENGDEAEDLAKAARDCGVDYLVIKPYSQHPLSRSHEFESVAYAPYVEAAQELVKLSDSRFKVIFRANAMRKWDEGARSYERCYALPFWTYIDSRGDVWGCSCYLGEQSFLYGNIYKSTFKEIWEGAVRTRSVHTVENELDTTNCRVNCRMDEINRYLWELKHPPAHVNFI
jgi:radical SAM protein with 4Fe4S-binding SPASM domain